MCRVRGHSEVRGRFASEGLVLFLGNIYGDNHSWQNRLSLQNFREEIEDFLQIFFSAQLILGGLE